MAQIFALCDFRLIYTRHGPVRALTTITGVIEKNYQIYGSPVFIFK